MLQDFFGRLGKTPDEVTGQDVFVWAHAPGLSGKPGAVQGIDLLPIVRDTLRLLLGYSMLGHVASREVLDSRRFGRRGSGLGGILSWGVSGAQLLGLSTCLVRGENAVTADGDAPGASVPVAVVH